MDWSSAVCSSDLLLGDVAGQLLRPQIDQHEVVVGAAGDDVEPLVDHGLGQRLGVVDDGLRVVPELRRQGLAEGGRLGGDGMHQRAALQAREGRRVDLLAEIDVVRQYHAAAHPCPGVAPAHPQARAEASSDEHTYELQSLMHIYYDVL